MKVEGPTPKNPYGFKFTQVPKAPSVEKYYLTLLSAEVHGERDFGILPPGSENLVANLLLMKHDRVVNSFLTLKRIRFAPCFIACTVISKGGIARMDIYLGQCCGSNLCEVFGTEELLFPDIMWG